MNLIPIFVFYHLISNIFLVGCAANTYTDGAFNVFDSSGNAIEYETEELEFASIPTNTSVSETFTIKNTGSSYLKLLGVQ